MSDLHEQMQKAAEEIFNEPEDENVEVPDLSEEVSGDTTDFEIPDDDSYSPELAADADTDSTTTPEISDDSQTFTYKADGQEFTATKEEVEKALSLRKGARQAFSDRAKLRKQVQQFQQQVEQLNQFKDHWLKVTKDASTPQQVFEKLTGHSFNDYMDQEIERRAMYAQATPEQRKLLDQQQEMEKYRRDMERFKKDAEEKEQKVSQIQRNTSKTRLAGMIEPAVEEFSSDFETKFSPARANKMYNVLRREGISDVKELVKQGYQLTPKLVRKVFERNARLLVGINDQQVAQAQEQTRTASTQQAKQAAEKAATQNYEQPNKPKYDDLAGKNPMDLFEAFKNL